MVTKSLATVELTFVAVSRPAETCSALNASSNSAHARTLLCLQRANTDASASSHAIDSARLRGNARSLLWGPEQYEKVLDKHGTLRAHRVHAWEQYRFSSRRRLPCLKW